MQKNIRMTFTLLFSLLMLFCLSACQLNNKPGYEPENAAALWEKVDQTMNTLDSMELTTTTKVVFFNGGYQFELNGKAYVLSTKECHYSESTNVVSCPELNVQQTTETVEAYYDGKMYISNSDGTFEQKLCSEMSHEQYDQTQGGELTDEIELTDCTMAEYARGEDGTWDLNFSGYTKKTIDKVLETLMLEDDILGAPIADMEVHLTANEDFYVQKLEIVFAFSPAAGESAPAFSVTAEYGGYNTATLDTAKLNTEEYTPVPDVRLMETIAVALQERQDAPIGKFSLSIETAYERSGTVHTSSENDIVTYGRKNGAFSYLITAQMDGQDFLIRYQSGEQTVTAGDQTHTAAQTEAEAKSFIDGLINSARYNANAVTDIQKTDEGVYVLTCGQLDLAAYTEALGGDNIQLSSASQQITVTFQEGKLVKIESGITLLGTEAGEDMSMVTNSVVTFDDSEQSL